MSSLIVSTAKLLINSLKATHTSAEEENFSFNYFLQSASVHIKVYNGISNRQNINNIEVIRRISMCVSTLLK